MKKSYDSGAKDPLGNAAADNGCVLCESVLQSADVITRFPCDHTAHASCFIDEAKKNGIVKCNVHESIFGPGEIEQCVARIVIEDDLLQVGPKSLLRMLRLLDGKASRLEENLVENLNNGHGSNNINLIRELLDTRTESIAQRYTFLLQASLSKEGEGYKLKTAKDSISCPNSNLMLSSSARKKQSAQQNELGSGAIRDKFSGGLTSWSPDALRSTAKEEEEEENESRFGNLDKVSPRKSHDGGVHRPLVFTAKLRNISPNRKEAVSSRVNQSSSQKCKKPSSNSCFNLSRLANALEAEKRESDYVEAPVEADITEAGNVDDIKVDREVNNPKSTTVLSRRLQEGRFRGLTIPGRTNPDPFGKYLMSKELDYFQNRSNVATGMRSPAVQGNFDHHGEDRWGDVWDHDHQARRHNAGGISGILGENNVASPSHCANGSVVDLERNEEHLHKECKHLKCTIGSKQCSGSENEIFGRIGPT